MSSRSSRGRGRGRGRNNNNNNNHQETEETEEFDYSAPTASAALPGGRGFASAVVEDRPKKVRAPPSKSTEELKRSMDIAKSRVEAITDMLEGDDSDVSLKRNVGVAIKHLRAVQQLLDV
jgi:hypothetical protein